MKQNIFHSFFLKKRKVHLYYIRMGMFRFRQAGTTSEGSGLVSLSTDTITSANKPVLFRAPAMMACAA